MSEGLARVTLWITGRVQGVFYRASALEKAQGLNLSGFVKNLADGSVEMVVEGPRYALEQFVEWAKQGPPSAEVENVSARWGNCLNEYRTFMIIR
ncbi:MAG: acylphosphatase [Clostridia bacterium]|nr:acylphosphatase [Deltaproteobacteria bacterium]